MEPRPIAMEPSGIIVDPESKTPVLVLRGIDDPRLFLPIFVGHPEARAIAAALKEDNDDAPPTRPMTHDLIFGLLGEMSAFVRRVVILDMREGTFYAELTVVDASGHEFTVDARPSDCIALAVRAGIVVHVHRDVLSAAGGVSKGEDAEGDGPPDAASGGPEATEGPAAPLGPAALMGTDIRLEELDPEHFGRFKM